MIDPRPAVTAIASSTGGSRAAEMFVAGGGEHVVPRHQEGWVRGLELLSKDHRRGPAGAGRAAPGGDLRRVP